MCVYVCVCCVLLGMRIYICMKGEGDGVGGRVRISS